MTVEEVIELIEKHRDQHLRLPVGEVGDPLRWSESGLHRAMAQELDTLLDEIQGVAAGVRSR